MKAFRVKLCGITRPGDAMLAQQLGVDLIGLIFAHDSPRRVSMATARSILAHRSPLCQPVAVFRNQTTSEILRITDRLHLPMVQLHGSLDSRMLSTIRKEGRSIILVADPSVMSPRGPINQRHADLLLFDNKQGGSGEPFDWSRKLPKVSKPFGIAGGLSIRNVEQAVRLFRPDFIDINSGVESSPGLKSAALLRAFMTCCMRIRCATS